MEVNNEDVLIEQNAVKIINELRDQFINKCTNGNTDEIKKFLDALSEDDRSRLLRTPDEKKLLPIHHAITRSRPEIVRRMLEADPSLIKVKLNKESLLSIACRMLPSNIDAVRVLLSQDEVEVNVHDDQGSTPLYEAVKFIDHGLAKMLLEKGADPQFPNRDGNTPLHLTATVGRREDRDTLLRLFLQQGADPAIRRNYDGVTPTMLTSSSSSLANLEDIIQECDKRARRMEENLPKDAEKRFNLRKIDGKLVIHKSVQKLLNMQSLSGGTCLSYAVAFSQRANSFAQYLLSLHVHLPSSRPSNGDKQSSDEQSNDLFPAVDCNLAAINGSLPLHFACLREVSHPTIVEMLKRTDIDKIYAAIGNDSSPSRLPKVLRFDSSAAHSLCPFQMAVDRRDVGIFRLLMPTLDPTRFVMSLRLVLVDYRIKEDLNQIVSYKTINPLGYFLIRIRHFNKEDIKLGVESLESCFNDRESISPLLALAIGIRLRHDESTEKFEWIFEYLIDKGYYLKREDILILSRCSTSMTILYLIKRGLISPCWLVHPKTIQDMFEHFRLYQINLSNPNYFVWLNMMDNMHLVAHCITDHDYHIRAAVTVSRRSLRHTDVRLGRIEPLIEKKIKKMHTLSFLCRSKIHHNFEISPLTANKNSGMPMAISRLICFDNINFEEFVKISKETFGDDIPTYELVLL